ncbi:MAG: haloacid dehalogenase-like hydrolase [Chitinophagaceae bacterium]|nr:haloacid dehalogenase-like hydrolase [Chitinophagaceae bacterium]
MIKYFSALYIIVSLISCQNNNVSVESTDKKDSINAMSDPLPSWNDNQLKKDIINYVTKVTTEGSSDFIPVENRIATFDNDGTLWAERPYVQELFAFYQVKKMVEAKPELAKKQPFKAVLENDKQYFAKGGDKALMELVGVTHTGMTEDQFEATANDFFATTTYPGRNVPIKQITYQPQIELLKYLRTNNFKTFIVTGGTIEFVRAIAPALYGIPKDQVVGTTFKYKFVDSTRSVIREPAVDLFNDKDGKPVGIQEHIGQRPVFACGNEGGAGDIAMLKYSQGNKYPSFQLLINHNDSIREFYYQEKDSASLKSAAKNNWHVVSMKDDWKEVFTK